MEFPQCCGIKLLTDFGNTPHARDENKYTPDQADKFIKTAINNARFENLSMVMITLNNDQMKVFKSVIKENGFKTVCKNFHENHNSTIFVLVKKLIY